MRDASLDGLGGFGFRSRRAHRGPFSPLSLVIATACVVLAAFGAGVIIAVYDGVSARDGARTIVSADEDVVAPLLYRDVHDALASNYEEVSLVYVIPQSSDAPTPPGVDEWPGEGEVLLSPALAAAPESEGFATRYGAVVGEIGPEGLASPTEKLAYIHPRHEIADSENMYRVSGFGGHSDGGWLGDAVARKPLIRFLLVYVLTVGLAVALLAGVAARDELVERRADNTVLFTLGFSTRERARWQFGKLWRPLALGGIIGIACCVPWYVADIHVPARSYVVQAGDVRAAWWVIAVLIVTFLVLYVALLVFLSVRAPRMQSKNRPEDRPLAYSKVRAGVCLLSTPLVVLFLLLSQKTASIGLFYVYAAVLLVVLFTQRDLFGMLLREWAATIRKRGHESNDPGAIIGAAGLESNARVVSSVAALLSAALIISSQAYGILSSHGESTEEAFRAYEAFRGRVIELTTLPGADTSRISPVFEALEESSPDLEILIARYGEDERGALTTTLAAYDDSVDMATLSGHNSGDTLLDSYLDYLSSGGDNRDEVLHWSEMSDLLAADQANWEGVYTYALVSAPGQTLDSVEIKSIVAAQTAPMWHVEAPEEGSYGGSLANGRQLSWIIWLGVIALAVALLAVVLQLTEDTRTTARRLAPTTVLAGSPDMLRKVCTIRVCLPPLIGIGGGLILSAMLRSALALSLFTATAALIPFAIAACVVAAVIVFFGWLSALYSSRRALNTWKVGSR